MANSFLLSKFPVSIPRLEECYLSSDQFLEHIGRVATNSRDAQATSGSTAEKSDKQAPATVPAENTSPFINAILDESSDKKMFTANGDGAFEDTGEALVNLFHELEDQLAGDRLRKLLDNAWKEDPDSTLKIIWNSRSIHLGKSSKTTFYRAVGWLSQSHPVTFIRNLPWLVRPVIVKKLPKEKTDEQKTDEAVKMIEAMDVDEDSDDDFEMVEKPAKRIKLDVTETHAQFDSKHGVAHGCWKDLLNILVLAANEQLDAGDEKDDVFSDTRKAKTGDGKAQGGSRKKLVAARYKTITNKLENDALYRVLHATVARLFAEQLKVDLARLQTGQKSHIRRISLAAKWAPSNKGMHDSHTFVSSTIAELLHPVESLAAKNVDLTDRSMYLKLAREAYQSQHLAPLRKHLDIVERHLTTKKYDEINYSHVPSLAMQRYKDLFTEKDNAHFKQFLRDVALGKANISGATLLPSVMVRDAMNDWNETTQTVLDLQWKTLVQRIKDSGTMQNSIAVCDVSGSMFGPGFKDGTTPLHSSIGLSLLLAEVCQPPFGGHFITFSTLPDIVQAGGESDKRKFHEKVGDMSRANWDGSTDIERVFSRCILKRAKEHKVKQEDMVKRIFIFSDMHFDQCGGREWRSSFERIKEKFMLHGYDMPEIVFWNLAGGRSGGIAPKPVQAHETGTALVSGYSQAMLKVFLDGGKFEEVEEDVVVIDSGGNEVKNNAMTPMMIVKKAIGHDAYRMLDVYD